jgi:uncharacterized coiled-coil DUF342 family protein
MARRAAEKTGKRAAGVRHKTGSAVTAPPSIDSLRKERDELRGELDSALARIKDLESRQDEIANRIAWVLDSLQSLLEKRG